MSSKPRQTPTVSERSSIGIEDRDPCDIALDLDLEGVRPEGLSGLQVGERLKLRLEVNEAYKSVVCIRATGVIVGAIAAFPRHSALVNCLDRGVQFSATVTELHAGGCHIFGGRDRT